MAASILEIYNRALQKIGAKKLTSIDEESVNGRACRACYEPRRDALLRTHRWNFAIARASLAADEAAPAWGRAYSYTLPSDFLKLIPTYPEDNDINRDWVIENGKILTDDSAPLYIRYIRRVTSAPEMDVLFRETLSADMGLEMAEELTQSNSKKEACRIDRDDKIKEAKKANAIEVVPAIAPDSSWITERS